MLRSVLLSSVVVCHRLEVEEADVSEHVDDAGRLEDAVRVLALPLTAEVPQHLLLLRRLDVLLELKAKKCSVHHNFKRFVYDYLLILGKISENLF